MSGFDYVYPMRTTNDFFATMVRIGLAEYNSEYDLYSFLERMDISGCI